MATIPIQLDSEIISKLDDLVRKGLYKNRSEAIRDQIIQGLNRLEVVNLSVKKDKHDKIIQKLILLSNPPNLIKSKRSAVELVAEGRER
jgi:Arc/MetJ-type ribon-helix-helix transcriptional regulator